MPFIQRFLVGYLAFLGSKGFGITERGEYMPRKSIDIRNKTA